MRRKTDQMYMSLVSEKVKEMLGKQIGNTTTVKYKYLKRMLRGEYSHKKMALAFNAYMRQNKIIRDSRGRIWVRVEVGTVHEHTHYYRYRLMAEEVVKIIPTRSSAHRGR